MTDSEVAVVEYARNVIAIWNQPRQDTAQGQATHAVTLTRGFELLSAAIAALDEERRDDES
ncbi:MAG: hypothetical protein KGL39_35220 [Patescibacteria group bacterium]|nr:hypothetical protein [Patescibacteria group bacterium]